MRAPSARATAELLDALLRRYHVEAFTDGLNPAQWAALRYFARDTGETRTAVALARHQGVSRASANDTVRALVRKGLLARAVSSADARRRDVSVTAKGVEVLASDPMHRLLDPISTLPDEARRVFADVMGQLLDALPIPARGARRTRAAPAE